MTTQRDLSQFVRPIVQKGEGPDVNITLTPQRVPGYRRVKNAVHPKELRWFDDDSLTGMEAAIYGAV